MNFLWNLMLDLVNSDEFDGLMRHGLSTVGGGLVASGALDTAQWQTISGAIAIVVAAIWSVASKKFIKAQTVKDTAHA